MTEGKILLVTPDPNLVTLLERGTLLPAGYEVQSVADREAAENLLRETPPHLAIISEHQNGYEGIKFGQDILKLNPAIPLILVLTRSDDSLLLQAYKAGFVDVLVAPLRIVEVVKAVQHALEQRSRWVEWATREASEDSKALRKQIDSLEAIQQIAHSVTSLLDLNSVLTNVVDAAVELTNAEEGSLLLLDEDSGELYMRASRNFQEEFVRRFRLPVRNTLAGQVVRTGRPVVINEHSPQKIKTAYLVHTLIYVPLLIRGRVIGVLGVDNRKSGHRFLEEHVNLVSSLANHAAIAIENAMTYERMDLERKKLETILTKVEDGVMVVDHDQRLIFANRTARKAFNLGDEDLVGRSCGELCQHPDLLEALGEKSKYPSRSEIQLDDGRIFYAQVTPIPEVGKVVTMQDITHLKELDRIKSDFVHTVSHDLRSPLTAILGYVELLERAGPITDQQRQFVRRVQISVNNITALINDLLDLGRIEAGFDTRMEVVSLSAIAQFALEELHPQIEVKKHVVTLDVQDPLPSVFGNPVRLRQMIANILSNAINYTSESGKIGLRVHAREKQVILQVSDNGPGISPGDQPYIFDKFYRGSNVSNDIPGTGLGLAIVKSIVDYHQGRIWVDSILGQGSTFTVVLPTSDQEG